MDDIKDMEKYYSRYRVFQSINNNTKRNVCQKALWTVKSHIFLNIPLSEEQMRTKWSEYLFLWALRNTHVKRTDYLLDVGCGSGRWLEQLAEAGFRNLYGVDKYADDISGNGWRFTKGDISAAKRMKYDFITFHHSFEHMNNPYEVLNNVHLLLKDAGICIIRIPVFGKEAWKRYGKDWYQIDAPRHYFIYSEKALRYMCKKAGLWVYRIVYDSDYGQFRYSEGYRDTDLSLYELADKKISPSKVKRMKTEALQLNELQQGDQAIFYIKKRST